jgi:hypothetical protein
MHDPETVKVWQMAFEKDFGGMAQGNNEMGQRGTNSIFVMTHTEIGKAYAQKQMYTFAKIVLDFCTQKEDPHHIQITAGGNLIKYKGDVSTQTVDLGTVKLLWNSVISTEGAQYMCPDIFFLT